MSKEKVMRAQAIPGTTEFTVRCVPRSARPNRRFRPPAGDYGWERSDLSRKLMNLNPTVWFSGKRPTAESLQDYQIDGTASEERLLFRG